MAIFYNHIKGCGRYATNTFSGAFPEGASEHQDAWSFIKFADILYVDRSDDTRLLTSVQNSPIIYLNAPNQPIKNITNECYSKDYEAPEQEADRFFTESNTYCLGHILTTNAKDQYVNKDFEFKKNLSIKEKETVRNIDIQGSKDNPSQFGSVEQSQFQFLNKSQLRFYLSDSTDSKAAFGEISYNRGWGHSTTYDYLDIDSNEGEGIIMLTSKGVVLRTGGLYVQDITSSVQTKVDPGVIKADKQCEALYFNAISDRRAKSNITPAEFSALDIIKQLPIYTFNYLNDPQLSVGLIAQEAAEHDLDGFNMVDNLDASGEFGDFMQMKESKLVYVLWKAVQELSAKVEELKAEIRNLK